MTFTYSAEQQMLATSVRQCFERLPPLQVVPETAGSSFDGEMLRTMAEEFGMMGLFGLLVPEEAGGLGMGFADAALIAREAGRAQVPYPVAEQIAAAFYLAKGLPDAAEDVIEGQTVASAAAAADIVVVASGSTLRLSGTVLVPHGRHARWLLIPCRDPVSGRSLAAVIDRGTSADTPLETDGFDLTQPLDRVHIDHEAAAFAPSDASGLLAMLIASEIVGVCEHLVQRTLQFVNDRTQFGSPIGKLQAVKHLLANCKLGLENSRVAADYAAVAFDAFRAQAAAGRSPDHALLDRAIAVAKSCSSRAARAIARDAVQMHGAMGFSWELGLHVPVRRLVRLSNAYGTAHAHQERLMELEVAAAAAAPTN